MTDARLSRAVPLDQLRAPETDIRDRRPEDAVMSLAASMGDPDVGQLQDILVHPVDPEDVVEDGAEDELHDLFAEGHPLRVVDGETRRLAAERLGWATIDATIVPKPPENTVIAQLDANTERIDMSSFETVRALYDHKEETGATLEELGEKTGLSPSYLSNAFSTYESPDWLTEPWRHPDHPLETSHAIAVKSLLTANTTEEYAQVGGLDDQAAYERAVEDAKLMIDVQGQHDLAVGEFRKRCKRCKKETRDELQDDRTVTEKTADGQTARAEQKASGFTDNTPDPEPCMVCGDESDRKIAIDVCQQDYGMLSEMKANDEILMAQGEPASSPQAVNSGSNGDSQKAAEALAAVAGIPPGQAVDVVEQVQHEAAQAAESNAGP